MNSRQILERNPHLITLAQSLATRCSISLVACETALAQLNQQNKAFDLTDGPPPRPKRASIVCVSEKMSSLRVTLLFLVSYATCSWAQTDASLTPITAVPCSGPHTQNVSLYSSDIYTVVSNLSQCSNMEMNETMVRTLTDSS